MRTWQKFDFGLISLLFLLFLVNAVFWSFGKEGNSEDKNLSLKGAWKYSAEESDLALKKAAKFFAGSRDSKKDMEIKALAVHLFPPEFVEFTGEKDEKVITEFFKELEQTRIVITDGRMRSIRQNSGFVFNLTATESENSLLILTKSESGVQFSETYQILEKEQKLKVIVRLIDSNQNELAKLNRIYERTTATQSINLTQAPL